jgi:hypothetical protein
MTEIPVKSKYISQINYDKRMKEENPEYKMKKNEMVKNRNKYRYDNDPEYRQKCIERARIRNIKVREVYNTYKSIVNI